MSRVHDALSRAQVSSGGNGSASDMPGQGGAPLFPIDGHEAATGWAAEPEGTGGAPEARMTYASADLIAEPEQAGHDGAVFDDAPAVRIGEKLVLSPEMGHDSIEQYRRLAGRLHLAQAEHGIKVVMVASALPGEGKTLTATNLALTLSESYQRNVLLIDGDLRRPSVHEMFRISNISGLNDGLRSNGERKIPLVRWSDHLTLITAGRPDADPMNVLVSSKMRKVISEAVGRFDWVIIDTPPVGLLTDASLFSAMVDTAILVVQAGRTPHDEVKRAVRSIGRDRVFGVVLNRAKPRAQGAYAGYEYRYAQTATK